MSKLRLSGLSPPQLGGVGGALVGPIKQGAQQLTNYGTASILTRVSEAAQKLSVNGIANSFNRFTAKLGLSQANGQIAITDPLTGRRLMSAGEGVDQVSPAKLLDEANENLTEQLKVRLTDGTNTIVFKVMPTIDETQNANYEDFTPIHHPGAIHKYTRTGPRSWSLRAKFISRNSDEAEQNIQHLNLIRSWVMPEYGLRTAVYSENVGAPPPVLTLSGYGPRMIGPVKCVLQSFNWTFPDGVDYIPTIQSREPFPVMLDISIVLLESWAPAEFSSFSIEAYRRGDLFGSETSAFYYVPRRAQQRTTRSAAAGAVASSSERFAIGAAQARAVDARITAGARDQLNKITPQAAIMHDSTISAMATDIGDFASRVKAFP